MEEMLYRFYPHSVSSYFDDFKIKLFNYDSNESCFSQHYEGLSSVGVSTNKNYK